MLYPLDLIAEGTFCGQPFQEILNNIIKSVKLLENITTKCQCMLCDGIYI